VIPPLMAFKMNMKRRSALGIILFRQSFKTGEEMEFADALTKLQVSFGEYIKLNVLTQTNLDNLGYFLFIYYHTSTETSEIFFVGIPPRNFPDFARLTEKILSGELLNVIAKEEPNDEAYNLDEENLGSCSENE
jgi:hypothetical protein